MEKGGCDGEEEEGETEQTLNKLEQRGMGGEQ